MPAGIVGELQGERGATAGLGALLRGNQFADYLGLRNGSAGGNSKKYETVTNKGRHGSRQSPSEQIFGPLQALCIGSASLGKLAT